jgi:predicted ATPase/DNA-binding SARP family transcriptional activator
VAELLHVQLLGGFRITYGDQAVAGVNTRLQALLAYLLLHRGAPVPRQQLAFLFWPDSAEAQARTNLRQLLHSLKQTLPEAEHFVQADAQTLQWRAAAPVRLDVAEFEDALARAAAAEQHADAPALRAALEQAVAAYQGDLLPSGYDDWLLPERERLRQAYSTALDRLVRLLERQGDAREAIACAERLLRHDPLREETYRVLMRLYAACGDRAGALRVYHTCAAVLERELAVEPSAATREAYEQLFARRVEAPARPLKPPQPPNTNLPVPLTSFVGREAELAEITQLLQTTRLLTLTGPGGCGKTRLALEAGTNQLDDYPDGVWWVELAALSDAALVPQAVATGLGVREPSGRPALDTLIDYLRAKQLLLLLDNCEHLVEASAQLAEQCLTACAHLHILATSREALSIGGETTWLVPSLSLPESPQTSTVEELSRYEAIRLFVERAAAVLPTFRLTAANGSHVAQICRRLDGIPLAIELAAARVKVLPVEQIAARLDDVFHLLTAGRRTALPRHQTLQAAMDWSYELLSDTERVLFRRLAVFAGGFTLEAAEAVCAGEGLEASAVLALLSHLVDKSLIAVTQDGATRYRLLDTIRQYAHHKLREAGEADVFQRQHAAFFLSLAKTAEPKMKSAERGVWMDRLDVEHDNLRAALGWSRESEAAEMVLELAGALYWFWYFRGYLAEARGWLEAALALGEAPTTERGTPARANALFAAGSIAWAQSDYRASRTWLEKSAALWRRLGAEGRSGLAYALPLLGQAAAALGDIDAGRALQEESLAIFREVGDRWGLAVAFCAVAGAATIFQGNDALGGPLYEASLAIFREFGDNWGISLALRGLARLAFRHGEYAAARSRIEEALRIQREAGAKWEIAQSLVGLGGVLQSQGDDERAAAVFQEGLALNRELGSRYGVAMSLGGLGWVAVAQGQPERAARLFGQVEVLREASGVPIFELVRSLWESMVDTARGALSEEAFARAWAEGRAMTLEEAIADALSLTAEQ